MNKFEVRNMDLYYGSFHALKNINIDIPEKEITAFIGPSGCGKSTFLKSLNRMNDLVEGCRISGDIKLDGVDIYKDKMDVNVLRKRVGMVFQKPNPFPMSIYDNIAYGPRTHGIHNKAQLDEIVERSLRGAAIWDEVKDRLNKSALGMSGGQQQRVALARALVIKPDVLLMDEPLSNLDAKLRLEMRQAIRKIQREVGITTVYVTHDQEEAMSISDTIAVMNAGKIQHIGTPRDIYQRPANTFVATFIGRTNILDARMEQGTLVFPTGERFTRDSWRTIPDGPVKVSVRPEEFVVHHADEKAGGLSAVLEDSVYLGLNTHYYLKLTGGASVELIQESAIDEKLEPGSAVTLTLKEEKINIFSEDGTKNYLRG